ncbi:MAG: hypothetical protein ACTHNU_09030 [Gaiellales bacterium]
MIATRRPALSPARLVLATAAAAGAVAAVVYWLGPPGVDQPAHVFQTWLFAQNGFQWWSNDWYSGRYQGVGYSLLFYPLASVLGIGPMTVAATIVLAAASTAAVVDRYGSRLAAGPCLLLAPTAAFNTVTSGAYPFLCGFAAAALVLLCAQREWRWGFVAAVLVTLGFSPLALVLAAAILVGFAAAVGLGRTLRERRLESAALIGTLALGAAIQLLFSLNGRYPYGRQDLITVTAFCVAGIALAGPRRSALGLRLVFVVYLLGNIAAYLVTAPIGANIDRLFLEAGTPMLWLAARVAGRRRTLAVAAVLVAAFVLQMQVFVRNVVTSAGSPSTSAAFWAPAVGFLRAHDDSQFRVEVVSSWGHWEADYLPRAGFPLARGWFRQDDFPQNAVLYRSHLDSRTYGDWLRSVGVRYVILPDGPLDYSSGAEARLLRSGHSGLRRLGRFGRLQVFELPAATPIVTGPGHPKLVSLARGRVVFDAPRTGTYVVRVRYTRYWSGAATAHGPNAMTRVMVSAPGEVRLAVSPGP